MKTAKTKKVAIELVSYSIKMVIPTGAYANIQPEIIVKAGTAEEAHEFIAPHMNKLWKEYYLINERRPEPAKPVVQASPVTPAPVVVKPVTEQPSPVSSVAFNKASQAIASCLSVEALDLIRKQIIASVKLTDNDKEILKVDTLTKAKELNGKTNPS